MNFKRLYLFHVAGVEHLNWSSSLHPPGRSPGSVLDGTFLPSLTLAGIVASAGKGLLICSRDFIYFTLRQNG